MVQYDYAFPLGTNPAPDSQISVLFDKDTLDMQQILFRASSLNLTSAITINAVLPITPRYFSPTDLTFAGMNCTQGTVFEQERLNYYVSRIIEIIFNKQ